MLHLHHSDASSFSRPMIRRDFICLLPKRGLDYVAENILSYLDAQALRAAEQVCGEWYQVISMGMLWKKIIERRVRTDSLWRRLMERRGWIKYLFKPSPGAPHPDHMFYRRLYPKIIQDIENLEYNWRCGRHTFRKIDLQNENSGYVCCVQFDDNNIVCGLWDSTIRIWDPNTLQCIRILTGHTAAVHCLQYDGRVIISGSFDSTVRVWDVKTGELINTLMGSGQCFYHLRFNNRMMVTCSLKGSVKVWNMVSPSEITLERVLVGHRDAVYAVDFNENYIVSASKDRTINVWSTSTFELVRSLKGHKLDVTCVQCRDRLVVSGSIDMTLRLWDVESGACLRTLEGHNYFVSCIQFNNKRIVSGAYGEIKVWDLASSLNHHDSAGNLCPGTSLEQPKHVCTLQFDDFQIVTLSDGSILIWDFLTANSPETPDMNK